MAIQNEAAKAWGENRIGRLGNCTLYTSFIPVAVSGLNSGVTDVVGGYCHSLAVQNGNVYAWSYAGSGALGNGTNAINLAPILSLDLGMDLIAVGAIDFSSYALAADGNL